MEIYGSLRVLTSGHVDIAVIENALKKKEVRISSFLMHLFFILFQDYEIISRYNVCIIKSPCTDVTAEFNMRKIENTEITHCVTGVFGSHISINATPHLE